MVSTSMSSTSPDQKSLTMPRIGPRTALKALISIGLTVAVFYLVFSRADVPSFSSFLTRFQAHIVASVIALAVVATALSVWRLKLIARDLGYRLTIRDAIAALSLGMLAGTVFFQVFGQLLARGALLSRRGMPVAATVTLTIYERAAAAGVSLFLAIAGGWYVFGRVTLDLEHGGLYFLKIVAGLTLAIVAGAWLAWGPKVLATMPRKFDSEFLVPIGRNILISTAIQLTTMAAYISAAHAVAPAVPLIDLAAASAVVMLAASLPISLAGWGMRELSAILALGVVGVPSDAALMVAIMIGVTSLLVIGAFAVSSLWSPPNAVQISSDKAGPAVDYGMVLAWVVPLLAATAVFFQLYIPVGKGELNVNLADPLAIVGGALLVVSAVTNAHQWPTWRLSWFNTHILLITAVLTFALLHGAATFGWTPWALTNRFAGWFILLGYGATGALIANRGDHDGSTILLRTFSAVACSIIALELFLVILSMFGIELPHEVLFLRVAGFAQNPNAFAFQILLALCTTFAADFRPRIATLTIAVCLIGIWFTASRAVIVTVPFVIAIALYLRLVTPRRLVTSAIVAACFVLLMAMMPMVVSMSTGLFANLKLLVVWTASEGYHLSLLIAREITGIPETVPPAPPWPDIQWPQVASPAPRFNVGSGTETSDSERMTSLNGALQMIADYPIFGGGLGRFVYEHLRDSGSMLVIHSTPLWILAETGIVGFVMVLALFGRIFIVEFKRAARGNHVAGFLILLLLSIGIVSLVHELFYQRNFWLLFGVAMAAIPMRQGDSAPTRSK
jgi:hypothetical protein